jgi:hypothetical protein
MTKRDDLTTRASKLKPGPQGMNQVGSLGHQLARTDDQLKAKEAGKAKDTTVPPRDDGLPHSV